MSRRGAAGVWAGTFALACAFLFGGHSLYAEEAPPNAQGDEKESLSICGLKAATTEDLRAQLVRLPGVKSVPAPDGYVALANPPDRMWTFTTSKNPAHPAVVCRKVVEEAGIVAIKMEMECGASRGACDKFTRDFQELNARMEENFARSGR